jgi:hypothetical protein
MKQLPEVPLQAMIEWGPCADYRDRDRLLQLTDGKETFTAGRIMELAIPIVDKLWVLLRKESLPIEVLDNWVDKALVGVPANSDQYITDGNQISNKLSRTIMRQDFWLLSRQLTEVFGGHAERSAREENERQYVLLVDEILRWQGTA